MKQSKLAGTVLVAVPLIFLAAFTAWADPEQAADENTMPATEASTPVDAVGSAEVADATGLDIVMDGSSLEAFEKSMEQVKETGTAVEYKSLTGAIDYLMLYDIGARRNMKTLASRLDGLTAYEVVERVKWRQPK